MRSGSTRRGALRSLAVAGTAAASGCFWPFPFRDDLTSGDLLIANDDTVEHTVTMIIKKTSIESDDAGRRDGTPTPDAPPLSEWTDTFTLRSEARTLRGDYFTEPGAYFIEVCLKTGATDTTWLALSEAGGDAVTGGVLYIAINNDGRVRTAPTYP